MSDEPHLLDSAAPCLCGARWRKGRDGSETMDHKDDCSYIAAGDEPVFGDRADLVVNLEDTRPHFFSLDEMELIEQVLRAHVAQSDVPSDPAVSLWAKVRQAIGMS